MYVKLFTCRYCKHIKRSYKNIEKHERKCNCKPTFLDLHYDNAISSKILKDKYFDMKYVANKKEIIPGFYSSYGDTVHVVTYDDSNKQIQLEYDLICYDHKGLSRIKIENIEVYDKDYCTEMLVHNLQNKNKLDTLWITLKQRYINYKYLLLLFQVLPLIIDLPDKIDCQTYSLIYI